MQEYGKILLFLFIGIGFSIILVSIPLLLAKYRPYKEKLTPYECGIVPLNNAKMPFNIHFYLIAILFIIFDLEIVLLFPFAIGLKSYSLLAFSSVMGFLTILILGLIYEWKNGALDI